MARIPDESLERLKREVSLARLFGESATFSLWYISRPKPAGDTWTPVASDKLVNTTENLSYERFLPMRRIIGVTLLLLATTGCITARRATLDPFMRIQNIAGPFVSQSFAERLARLVIEEKYPNFSIQGSGNVADKGDK